MILTSSLSETLPLKSLHQISNKIMETSTKSSMSLISALRNCNSKSPSLDNISKIFNKKLPPIGLKFLFQIYNNIWTQEFFP